MRLKYYVSYLNTWLIKHGRILVILIEIAIILLLLFLKNEFNKTLNTFLVMALKITFYKTQWLSDRERYQTDHALDRCSHHCATN